MEETKEKHLNCEKKPAEYDYKTGLLMMAVSFLELKIRLMTKKDFRLLEKSRKHSETGPALSSVLFDSENIKLLTPVYNFYFLFL